MKKMQATHKMPKSKPVAKPVDPLGVFVDSMRTIAVAVEAIAATTTKSKDERILKEERLLAAQRGAMLLAYQIAQHINAVQQQG